MKVFIVLTLALIISLSGFAQQDSTKLKVITKTDGTQYVGKILSDDGREIFIETTTVGKLYIKKENIRLIRDVIEPNQVTDGNFNESNVVATRYFISTNGFPIERNQSYVMLNIWGPEVQYAIIKNLTIGFMTTWVGAPLMLSAKYSFQAADKLYFATGIIGGSSTWIQNFRYQGILGYGSATYGTKDYNVSVSGGYAGLKDYQPVRRTEYSYDYNGNVTFTREFVEDYSGSSTLASLSGTARLGKRVSFVMENFYYREIESGNDVTIIAPGLRFTNRPTFAFQFGLASIITDNQSFPIPFLSWMLKI